MSCLSVRRSWPTPSSDCRAASMSRLWASRSRLRLRRSRTGNAGSNSKRTVLASRTRVVISCARLEMLARIGEKVGVPLLTDVHGAEDVSRAAEICDCLQIPAFLCRQTSLIAAAAGSGRVINLKKGQFLSPEEMGLAVEKAERNGAAGVMVTERGTFFGYNNLVVDFTSFPRMKPFGVPLIFDATHSLQLPGGRGSTSGGRPGFARLLARSAVAAGCDGLFIETHFEPLSCGCDAEVMMPFDDLHALLTETAEIFRLVRSFD